MLTLILLGQGVTQGNTSRPQTCVSRFSLMKVWYVWSMTKIAELSKCAMYLEMGTDTLAETMHRVTIKGIRWFQHCYGANHRDNCLSPRHCRAFSNDGHMKTYRPRCEFRHSNIVLVPELQQYVTMLYFHMNTVNQYVFFCVS